MATKHGKLIEYLKDRANMQLHAVTYLLEENQSSEPVELTVTDDIHVDSVGSDGIFCTITRSLGSDPDVLSIEIVVRVKIGIREEYKNKIDLNTFDIQAAIGKGELNKFFVDPASRLSLLMANITSSFSGTPIIAPIILPSDNTMEPMAYEEDAVQRITSR